MLPIERLIGAPLDLAKDAFVASDKQTNGAATASQAAPGVGKQLVIVGFMISVSGAPAAAVTAQIRYNSGGTVIREFEIPAAAFMPLIVEFKHAMVIPENMQADLLLPALGAGIVGKVELLGFITLMTS